MNNEQTRVLKWLKSRDIVVPTDWVIGCLSWISSEGGGETEEEKLNMVCEQWLFTNLQDLDTRILPSTVKNDVSTLNGKFCVQIMKILDISKSEYSQRKDGDKYDDTVSAATQKPWEKKAARMLMLTLSDGVEEISGLEMKYIKILSDELPFGTKIRITGPVECRRGVLLLNENNIEVLGGEVEVGGEVEDLELLEAVGAVESNIQSMSNNEETLVQSTYSDTHSVNNHNLKSKTEQNNTDNLSNNVKPERCVQKNKNSGMSSVSASNISTLVSNLPSRANDENSKDEKSKRSSLHGENRLKIQKIDFNSIPNVTLTYKENQNTRVIVKEEKPSQSPPTPYPTNIKAENLNSVAKIEYLCERKRHFECDQNSVTMDICIKSVVLTLLSKLKRDNCCWSLKACICDGTDVLDIEFNNDVLQSLIGISCSDFPSSSSVIGPELKAGLENCRIKIMNACHFMDVKMTKTSSSITGVVSKIHGLT